MLQALSKALMELRADLVSQAGEDARANAEHALQEINVQKVVNKRTKELTVSTCIHSLYPPICSITGRDFE